MAEQRLTDDRGAIMILGVFLAVFMTGMLFYMSGIAAALTLRDRLQDSADTAVFGAAVLHARGMNLLVLLNQIMAALLAILIGLRLVEMLATLGILLATAFAFVPIIAGLIAPLQTVRQTAHSAYESLDKQVHGALKALHATEVVVKDVVPALAAVSYSTEPKGGPRTVVAPARLTLPVEADAFSVLCERAGRDAGTIAMLPLNVLVGGTDLSEPISDGVGDLASSASDWFCGKSGSKPPKIERTIERVLPVLSVRAQCEDASSGKDSGHTEAACRDVERIERASQPNDDGECQSECGQTGAYEERVQKAREQCDPGRKKGLHGFQWSERTVRVRLDENGRFIPIEHSATRVVRQPKTSPLFPCGREDALYARTYERRVHEKPGERRVLPLCTSAPEPIGGFVNEFRIVEVLQVFQCVATETRTISEPGQDGKAGDQDDEAPMRLQEGLSASSDDFQVRSASAAAGTGSWIDRVVEVSAWGNAAAETPAAIQGLSGLMVAEAEYGFDAKASRGEWMWSRSWTARLSRVRAPADTAVTTALVAACAVTAGDSTAFNCASAALAFGPLAGEVAH